MRLHRCEHLRDIIQRRHNGVQDLIRGGAQGQTGRLQPVAYFLVRHGLLGRHLVRQLAERRQANVGVSSVYVHGGGFKLVLKVFVKDHKSGVSKPENKNNLKHLQAKNKLVNLKQNWDHHYDHVVYVPLPGLSGGRLQLVDPRFVHVHRVGVDAQTLVLDDVFDHWSQELPERVVATRSSVEAHHHLDDGRVPRHDVLDLIHLRTETRRQTR